MYTGFLSLLLFLPNLCTYTFLPGLLRFGLSSGLSFHPLA